MLGVKEMELHSEDVKEAIIKRLLEIAPDVEVYKEATTNVKYPHFFVHQINVTDEEERKDYHLLSYSMDIRYRTVSDPSTDLRLNQNLAEMGMKLLVNFNTIDFEDSKIRCKDKSVENENGVLHFFTTLQILVKLDKNEEHIKQNKLGVNFGR